MNFYNEDILKSMGFVLQTKNKCERNQNCMSCGFKYDCSKLKSEYKYVENMLMREKFGWWNN